MPSRRAPGSRNSSSSAGSAMIRALNCFIQRRSRARNTGTQRAELTADAQINTEIRCAPRAAVIHHFPGNRACLAVENENERFIRVYDALKIFGNQKRMKQSAVFFLFGDIVRITKLVN